MIAERTTRRLRWAACLPVLVALLLSFGSAPAGHYAVTGSAADLVGTGVAGMVASTSSAVPGERVEPRLQVKRADGWAASGAVTTGGRAAYRLGAPAERWTTRRGTATPAIGQTVDGYRGRDPPTAA